MRAVPATHPAKRGRVLTIRPHHDQQAAARQQAATDPDWQAAYRRLRPPVGRAVAWLIAHGKPPPALPVARAAARRLLPVKVPVIVCTVVDARASARPITELEATGQSPVGGHVPDCFATIPSIAR
jgi:hypothetical protein